MNSYLVKYSKTQNAKYISHLDFMRTLNRAMRRAHLPIAYSHGFNPHPIVSFLLPLPVGITSECELMEINLNEALEPDNIKGRLNAMLPEGIEVLYVAVGSIGDWQKNLAYAKYEVALDAMPTEKQLAEFLSLPEILIEKKTKHGIKETDIRPNIFEIDTLDGKLILTIAAGSMANLKPDDVICAMNKYIEGYNCTDFEAHRIEFIKKGDLAQWM